MKQEKPLRNLELRLLSELMKNCRTSDRKLSKLLGVSQPTVTRTRAKLEKQGYIKEYAAIPDFAKLGYTIMAVTWIRVRYLSPEEYLEAQKTTAKDLKTDASEIILFERALGENYEGVMISFHRDYSSYAELIRRARGYPFIESTESLLVDLTDKTHYRSLTLSTLAKHILKSED
jgi:DNA-binding Lrp family transcriptional regulator